MKKAGAIVLLFALLFAAGCGGGSSDPGSGGSNGKVVLWHEGKPVGIVGQGAPPKKLVVKDVKVGSGTVLKKGATMTVRYRNFNYQTGRQYEDWWERPFVTGFGKGESLGAWETGLKGMRVGGRRELIVPAKEAYTHVPEIYVLELVSVS